MRTVDVGSQAGAGRRRVLRIPVIALLVLGCSVRGGPAADPTEDPRLADLLAHMSRVASLYRALALRFECTETLEYTAREDWPSRSGFARFSYLYQRDEEGRFEDCRLYRTTLTTAERSRCVLPDEPGMPLYLRNAYLWILAFSDTRRPWHEYRIAGEQAVLGRPAILVEFGPRGAVRPGVNDWYGRAWIDRDTYQLLRVHAMAGIGQVHATHEARCECRLQLADFRHLLPRLCPLPLLGVPGWWPANADPAFYDDASVFRSRPRSA